MSTSQNGENLPDMDRSQRQGSASPQPDGASMHTDSRSSTPPVLGAVKLSNPSPSLLPSGTTLPPQSAGVGPKGPAPVRPGPPFQQEAEANFKPRTVKFWLIIVSNFVTLFLVALDRTILSTAIPRITDEFGSLGDIGWYGSAYMLTTAAFQLLFGRIYRFYDLKWTMLCSIILFELGSIICGAAPTSPVFILGRAIAGLGSAGIFTGAMMVIIPMVPLHKRPIFQSMFGAIFGIASVAGPLVGGAFTETATWRWCFYMNVPVGAVAFSCLALLLKSPKIPREPATLRQQTMRLDPAGTCLFVASVACLVLALQWGGSVYPWANWRLIILLVVFGITAIAFGVVQVMMPESASLPMRIVKQRSVWAGACFVFFLSASLMICVFYMPLWFQTSKGVNPVKSGIYTLPLVMSMVASSIMSGALTQRSGYYVPSMLLCSCFMSVGQGLLTTLKPSTGSSQWIAYQFLVGFGVGFGIQTASLAVQTTLPKPDIPTGIAITFFAQQLGGAIFTSVGQTILSDLLVRKLNRIPGINSATIVESGATELQRLVPERFQGAVINAYNDACTRIFVVAAALSCIQLLCALAMEWKSIKKGKQGTNNPEPGLIENQKGSQ